VLLAIRPTIELLAAKSTTEHLAAGPTIELLATKSIIEL
jgi:hypothetical protein